MEVEVVHRRQQGLKVTIECPEADKRAEELKKYIEAYECGESGQRDIAKKKEDRASELGGDRIKGQKNGTISLVAIKDIYYFESVDDRTFLYTKSDCMEVRYRIYELEEMLCEQDFIRTSKSQIINIKKMKSLEPQLNRTILVTMDNDECLYISRKYVKNMKEKLGI